MASYTLKDINDNFWRKVKGEAGYRGVSIKGLILDHLRLWVKDSIKLRRRERKVKNEG
jgi:hypothetical protein